MSALVAWLRRSWLWTDSRQSWLDRAAVAGLVAGALALLLLHSRLPLAAQVLGWVLLLAAAAFASHLFGPVLFYDLVCIARRNRYYLIRTLYALFLLTMLWWVHFAFFADRGADTGLRPDEAVQFASWFFTMFMGVQFLVVTVVTPAYVAGAIAEEKERKTLEFLLATDLGNREIVLSKLAARVLNLMLLVLTGLPVLAALQFLGGVDPTLVIAGFVATLLTVASLAGLSILASVLCRRARDAIVLAYLVAGAYLVVSGLSWLLILPAGWKTFPSTPAWTSPVTLGDVVQGFSAGNIIAVLSLMSADVGKGLPLDDVLPTYLRDYALFHGAVAVFGPLWAVLRLRAVALKETGAPARPGGSGPVRRRRRRRVGDHPIIWKEVFTRSARLQLPWFGRWIVYLLVVLSLSPLVYIAYHFLEGDLETPVNFFGARSDPWEAVNESVSLYVVRLTGTAVACLLLVGVAVRASSTISIERDRQTLDSLLTTPLSSDAILFGKWLGAVLSVRWGWLWLGVLWGSGVLTGLLEWLLDLLVGGSGADPGGALHPLALLLLVVTWFVYAAFLAGLGTWFSTVSRTTLRATTWTLVCAVGAALGHWLIWMCCIPILIVQSGPMPEVISSIGKYQAGLTPMLNLGWFASFKDADFRGAGGARDAEVLELIGFGVLGTATWAVLAVALWVATSNRFRQVAGRSAYRPERHLRAATPAPRPGVG